jgi:hypothetical protein
MDIFVDKNGKKVLTVKDNGDEVRDDKYFEDKKKRLEEMTDDEVILEMAERKLQQSLLDAVKKCCGGGCHETGKS